MAELAEKVSLSQSPCWRRVQLLERAGFILGYRAQLDRSRPRPGVHWLREPAHGEPHPRTAASFERQVVALPR